MQTSQEYSEIIHSFLPTPPAPFRRTYCPEDVQIIESQWPLNLSLCWPLLPSEVGITQAALEGDGSKISKTQALETFSSSRVETFSSQT